MAQGVIYMVDGDGLRRMTPSAPENEDRMQELVARYPELITDGDGDLLLIRREAPVGDGEVDGRWSLDHLFVTREGVPVLVELKRAVDTRLRREVVGQMLDYAANATAHWEAGAVARSFTATAGAEEADALLAEFIGDRAPDEFWGQVDSNLRAGRIKLVFVADSIPRELARIVEFLNDQMRADVRAVELRWFTGEGGVTTLSPRVIGETERAAAAKTSSGLPRIGVDDWIAERIAKHGSNIVAGVERCCAMMVEAGGDVFVPSSRGSIMVQFKAEDGIHWVYPLGVYPSGMVVLRLGYLKHRPAFADERERRRLYDQLVAIVGPLHTASLSGEPGFRADKLLDGRTADQVAQFLAEVVAAGRKGSGSAAVPV